METKTLEINLTKEELQLIISAVATSDPMQIYAQGLLQKLADVHNQNFVEDQEPKKG